MLRQQLLPKLQLKRPRSLTLQLRLQQKVREKQLLNPHRFQTTDLQSVV